MKLNKKQIAKEINGLAKVKAKIAALQLVEHAAVLVLKKAGGGESATWRAELIAMPKKVVVVKAHKQLRLYEKGAEQVRVTRRGRHLLKQPPFGW